MKLLALTFFLTMTSTATADVVIENFSSRTDLETAAPFAPTAVWNQTLGKIHPSLQVAGYNNPDPPIDFDIGDGSDGIFDSTTYAHFSQNGDTSGGKIRLDLNAHPTLQVTTFTLEQGWILEPVGTSPLVIKSQGAVNIRGDIWCRGEAGGNGGSASAGAGGHGRCGGSDGGNGGAPNSGGSSGVDNSGSVTGGQGGDFNAAFGVSGGGGGARSATGANDGAHFTAGGGTHGNSQDDATFAISLNSGGGGGGGSGSAAEGGGGGGGGGGSVIIYAGADFNLGASPSSAFGYIYADGGSGGQSLTASGAGGGGGGGSVLVFAAGTINIYNSDPHASTAQQGTGGTNSVAESGGDGGLGRSWFTSLAYHGVGSYYPPEEFTSGDYVRYNSASQYVVSKIFDLHSARPAINGVTLSPTSGDFTVEYRASADSFAHDDTGWTTNLSAIQNKRYLRYRLSVATSNATAPTMIDTATLSYVPGLQTDFGFKAAGCARVDDKGAGYPPAGFLACALGWMAAMVVWRRRLVKNQIRKVLSLR